MDVLYVCLRESHRSRVWTEEPTRIPCRDDLQELLPLLRRGQLGSSLGAKNPKSQINQHGVPLSYGYKAQK